MAQIPTAADLGRRPTAGGGFRVSVPRFDDQARALQSVGQDLGQVGDDLYRVSQKKEAEQKQKEAFDRQTRLIQFETETNNAYNAAQKNSVDLGDDAPDFSVNQLSDFDKRAEQFTAGLQDVEPEELSRLQAKFGSIRSRLANRASTFEGRQKESYYTTRINDTQNKALLDIDADPESMQDRYNDVATSINASGLTPKQKRDRLTKLGPAVAQSAIQGLLKKGQIDRAQELLDGFVDASDGSGAAASPTKGVAANIAKAEDLGKMPDDEWLGHLQAARPEIVETYQGDREALLKLRESPTLTKEILADSVEEQSQILEQKGFDASPDNLYIANTFGMKAAEEILKADDDTPLSSIVAETDATAGKTVKWLKSQAKSAMLKDGVTEATRIAIGPKWVSSIQREIDRADSAMVKQTASKAQDEYQLSIATRPGQVNRQGIIEDPRLDSGQKASLIKNLDAAMKEQRERMAGAYRYDTAPGSFNPFEDKDKKQLNEVFDQITAGDPERALPAAMQIVQRTGIAPPKVVNGIRSGLAATNVNEFAVAAEMAGTIYSESSKSFIGQKGSKQVEDAAVEWNYLTEDLQVDPKRAAEIMMQVRDPAQQQKRTILEAEAKEITKDIDAGDIGEQIDDLGDPSDFFGDADFATTAQEEAFSGDYRSLFRLNYIQANGNEELAKVRTIKDMQKIYGPSSVSPPGVDLVKYPAENYYPRVLGSYDYIKEQAQEIVNKTGKEVGEVFLQATPQTRDDIKAGRPPRYMIMYEEEIDGIPVMQVLPGNPLFRPELGDNSEFLKKRESQRYVNSYLDGELVKIDRTTGTLVDENNKPISQAGAYDYIEHPLAKRGVDTEGVRGVIVPREAGEPKVERRPRASIESIENETRPDRGIDVSSIADKIIQAESGGNPEAMSSTSTAVGAGQFIESTWLATVRKHKPELLKGRTRKEVLDLRTDPQISREITVKYAEDNIEKLEKKNIPITPENVYLSHFLGPTAAPKVLKADPDKQLAQLLPKRVLNANKFLKGRNAGWLIDWAKGKV